MPAFRISGGLLLFLIAVEMLFERRSERRETPGGETPPDPSVFPLAMPLIAGPGALATMILLRASTPATRCADRINLVMVAVLALTYVLFRWRAAIERLLGHTGIVVADPALGILLAALGGAVRARRPARPRLPTGRAMRDRPRHAGRGSSTSWCCSPFVAGFFVLGRRGLGRGLRDLVVWVLIFAMVVIAYGFRDILRGELFRRRWSRPPDAHRAAPRLGRHFHADARGQRRPVRFMVDTGASDLVLSRRDAERVGHRPGAAGLRPGADRQRPVATASVRLGVVEFGGFTDTGVPASVSGGALDVSLLGMSYLDRFERIEIAGDRMTLRR